MDMDYENLFDEIEIIAEPFALCELRGTSDLRLKEEAGVTLHYVLAGEGELQIHGEPSITVGPGTLALVPTFRPHSLRSLGGPKFTLPHCRPVEMNLLRFATDPQDNPKGGLLAICCRLDIGFRGSRGLINLLRTPIIKTTSEGGFLLGSIDQLLAELSTPKLGSRAIVRAIILQCVIRLLRDQLLNDDPQLRWMAILKDEGLWLALKDMLDNPAKKHTVDSLAEISAMSRSTFAARFSKAYGNGPMELLRALRMEYAAELLTKPSPSIDRVALQSGFKSRSAFSRAFKAAIGLSPQQHRSNSTQKS